MSDARSIPSPLLDHCPATLPAEAYFDRDWFDREMAAIWRREWVYAGRLNDVPEHTLRRVEVAAESVLLARGKGDAASAFFNVCRHRGAELCGAEDRAYNGRLISCPYHAWAYDGDGRLRSTGFATPGDDFDRSAHGLFPVASKLWAGGIYLCLSPDPPEFAPDLGVGALDNWPMDRLVTGHVVEKVLACNWKIFWENYNECLHCPGIHPALSQRVPVYRKGIMSAGETGGAPFDGPVLADGAVSWTVSGRPCGPEFPRLSPRERETAHNFVTLYPSSFTVAHVDYVRTVSLKPLGPEETRLTAEWLFPPETLAAGDFDLADVVDFATGVLNEDGAACEMNQRGLKSSAYRSGRLMPQEFDIAHFHDWVRTRLG